jgi:hypothetical protein
MSQINVTLSLMVKHASILGLSVAGGVSAGVLPPNPLSLLPLEAPEGQGNQGPWGPWSSLPRSPVVV